MVKRVEELMGKIVRLVRDEAKPDGAEQPTASKQRVSVKGNGNTIATGHVVNINQVVRNTVKPDPTGTITPEQKSDLQALINDWVTTHNVVKKAPLTHKLAWSKMNRHCRVNSYHELKAEQFDKAAGFIRTQKGKILSMKSAPKKDADFRRKAYTTIFARGAELGDKGLHVPYIEKNFGTASLKDLSDEELQQTRRWILAKRPK